MKYIGTISFIIISRSMYYSDLTSEMQSHVVILKAVSNSLSILGTSAIILIYLFIKEVRSFSFRLVVNLAMADLL